MGLIGVAAADLSIAAVVPVILPLFNGGGGIPLLLASVLPVAVAATGLSAPARLAAHAGVGVALMAALPGGALGGLGSGGARLVTGSLPALASGPPLGIAVAFAYLAAVVAVETARTGRRPLASLAPGGVLLALALLVGAGGLPQPRWAAVLYVAAGALSVLTFQLRPVVAAAGRGRQDPLTRPAAAGPLLARRVLAGAAATAAVALLALPLGSALPGAHARRPYDLRAIVAPIPHPVNQLSLLATYASIYDGPVSAAFTAQASGADPRALYWRLAVFDIFNGAEWTSSAIYQPAGTRLPARPRLDVPVVNVHAHIQPAGLMTGYLPAPDRPQAISVSGLGVGSTDGELVIPAATRLPPRIDITSAVPNPAPAQLLGAGIPAGSANQGAPAVPPTIAALARRLAATAPPTLSPD